MVWIGDGRTLFLNDGLSPRAPRMITMEPWYEVVFMAADGEHTVGEFIKDLVRRDYEGRMPEGLVEQTHGIIRELVDEGIVRLHPTPEVLPPYFAEMYLAQPPEVRAEQMRRDGRIRPAE